MHDWYQSNSIYNWAIQTGNLVNNRLRFDARLLVDLGDKPEIADRQFARLTVAIDSTTPMRESDRGFDLHSKSTLAKKYLQ
jgi:hypothetical protein